MTTQPFHLDPDVEHILQEVAKDPRSSLLRVERPKIIRGLTEREPSVGVATAGLTTAERHLVQTRRAETAYALRALCLYELLTDVRAQHLFSRQGAASVEHLSAIASQMRDNWTADKTSHVRDLGSDADAAWLAIERGVKHRNGVLQLGAAAQCLEPTNFERLYFAAWMILEGQPRSAIGMLLRIASAPETSVMRSVAGTNLGLAYYEVGDFARSRAWYRSASLVSPDYFPCAVGRFILSLQLGDREDALSSAGSVEDLATNNVDELTWLIDAQHRRRRSFQVNLTKGGRDLLPRLRDALGPASRRLVNAVE